MKFSYFMILILLLVGVLQYGRTAEMSEYYSLKQMYNFNLEEPKDGNLDIENPQKHLVLLHEDETSQDVYSNLKESFKFSKVNYETIGIFEEIKDIDEYASVIIITELYTGMKRDTFEKLENFLREGGNLIFLRPSFSSPFNKIIGIEKIINYDETAGIVFKKDFFRGMDEIKPSEEMMSGTSLDIELDDEVEVIATDNYDSPIIWEKKVGLGRIVSVNTTLIEAKVARGLLSQLIAYGNDYFVMSILNSKVFHLDDFPAPIPDGSNKLIYEDYHLKTRSFFKKIWWKDMVGIGTRQNIKYTGFLIGEYNDIVEKRKMLSFYEAHIEDLGFFGRKLYQDSGEIGIHGYNHFSLAFEGAMDFEDYDYKPWPDEESMIYGLKSLKSLMNDIYGEEVKVYSYVPPSNILTVEGKRALIKSFPYLQTISGLYIGKGEDSVLIQEIGRDPDYPTIYALPRFSSGLFYTEDNMWGIYNGVATYGMVSHFFHPDDILDEERGEGKSWEELKNEFEGMLKHINKNFSVLDPQVQSMATKRYMKMEDIKLYHEKKTVKVKNKTINKIDINIEGYRGEVNTFVRLRGEKIKDVVGGEFYIIEVTPDYNLYLVKLKNEEIEIILSKI